MKTQLRELATVGLKPVLLMLGETVFLARAGARAAALGHLKQGSDDANGTIRSGVAASPFACSAWPRRPHRRPARARARSAQGKWPDKTVRIVAAGPAGGSADIVARLLADQLVEADRAAGDGRPASAGAGGVLAVNELSLGAARRPHAAGRRRIRW